MPDTKYQMSSGEMLDARLAMRIILRHVQCQNRLGGGPGLTRRLETLAALAVLIPMALIGFFLFSAVLLGVVGLLAAASLAWIVRNRWRRWRMDHQDDGRRNVRVVR